MRLSRPQKCADCESPEYADRIKLRTFLRPGNADLQVCCIADLQVGCVSALTNSGRQARGLRYGRPGGLRYITHGSREHSPPERLKFFNLNTSPLLPTHIKICKLPPSPAYDSYQKQVERILFQGFWRLDARTVPSGEFSDERDARMFVRREYLEDVSVVDLPYLNLSAAA